MKNKNLLVSILLIFILSLCLIGLTACGNVEFKLNFVVDNEVYATVNTSGAETIKMPENPTKNDYTFDGWFWDKDVWEKPFTANSLLDAPLSSDMSVYAKFTKNHTHEYNSVVTEPTCTEKGYTTHTCSCNDSYVDTYVDELGHEYGVWVSNSDGTHTKTCANDNTHKIIENCNGGTATCQERATCNDCDTFYGAIGTHNKDTEWSQTETHHYHACLINGCTEKLDKEKHTFDKNKKCTVCEYITTALMGTEIASDIYEIDGTNLFIKVPNSQNYFNFAETIEVAEGASYRVFSDINCKEIDCIPSYAVNDLKVENNTYYFLVSNGNAIPKVYTVTVRRRPMYDVTFNTNGGTSVAKQVIEEDFYATEPTTTRAGYDFVDWDYDFNNPITKNTEITASWQINQYTLRVVYYNGQDDLVLTQDYGTEIQTVANPEKLGYTFTGWDKSIPSTMPAEDLIINAKWQVNQYSITIVYANGQANKVIRQDYNTDINEILPIDLEREGYMFTGWDKDIPIKMPAEDLTINATWDIINYIISYDLNGGTILENSNPSFYTVESDLITLINPRKKNYGFLGWYNGEERITTIKKGTVGELKLIAKWGEYALIISGGYLKGVTDLARKTCYEIEIPDSVRSIKDGAFHGCEVLESISLPFIGEGNGAEGYKGVFGYIFGYSERSCYEKIDGAVFQYVKEAGIYSDYYYYYIPSSLKEITIRNSATKIGTNAFYNCSFEKVYYNGTIDEWVEIEFGDPSANPLYNSGKSFYINNELVTEANITIATKINDHAFYNCSSLTSVVIGDSVTSIGNSAFYNCSSLTSITISNSVTSIGSYVFGNCISLRRVFIPNSIQIMGTHVFDYCESSLNIYCGVKKIPDGWDEKWHRAEYFNNFTLSRDFRYHTVYWDSKN